ncbi:Rhomboid-like protein 19 [Beauveria bassiana]|uniref:Eukaryotic integral membrane protein n=1 Tax=Beauveria bassiana (strain ARSEF 2860) TaxID=655819 RepID=J4UGQ3_BEAB2|nr:eukaryotic integral membrane protein [Beauveria bassiana ARSEF 2860]EJP62117.1 eukaryotic integral membrane protein [Beauveria bassiana ARSEF 2860]KAF1738332.1 Rhomboid-like protein 19 [Beauveria bassiana]KAH8721223.1 Rhomboid-like protein 19 [Beauveria bassiana]
MPPRINIPPVTRVLLVSLIAQSALGAAIRYRQWSETASIVIPYLTLIPQLSLVYPWTLVTTTLVESNIFTLAIACFTLYQGGRYLERAWSSADLAKFILVVSLVPNILTFGTMVFFFTLTRNERWTLCTIAGTIPLQISFLVAFSQLVPAHTVTLFRGVVSLRVMRTPILYIGLVAVLGLTPLLSRAAVWQAMYGFLASWTYLRFYKTVFPDLDASQPTSLRGDASETFAFAEFFPAPAKPVVSAVSNQVFDVLVAVRLCTPFSATDVLQRRGGGGGSGGAPGGARAEAERRRAIALRALDQRLNAASNAAGKQAPQPASQTAGPPVHTQPQTTQAAMTTEGQVLGETKFEPESDSSKS